MATSQAAPVARPSAGSLWRPSGVRTVLARPSTWVAVVLLGLLIVVPPMRPTSTSVGLLEWEYVLAIALVAVGMDIVTGSAGQLTLGPGAVFAVAGFAAALIVRDLPSAANLGTMIVAGILAALVVGVITGMPALRIGGFYLANGTLFFALFVPIAAQNLSWTGGNAGISLVGRNAVSALSGTALYELTVAFVLLAVGLAYLVRNSRVGRRFVALRTSEELARSVGISVYNAKLSAFLLGAVPAGLAGAVYVYTQQFMSPASASPTLSLNVLEAIVIGGIATTWGPLIGAALVMGGSNALGPLNEYSGIIFGGLLLAVVRFSPDGLVASPLARLGLGRRRHPAPTTTITATPPPTAPPEHTVSFNGDGPSGQGLLAAAAYRRGGDPGPLVVEGATKRFGGVLALEDGDMRVQPGTIHALIGPNGSGKTTLLNMISGFYSVDAGHIWLGEQRLDGLAAHRIARAGIARTFQTPKLVHRATALENVLIGADASSPPHRDVAAVFRTRAGRETERQARHLSMVCLELVGAAHCANHVASDLPHGMQRLVEVARGMATSARYLLLDEPMAGLSMAEGRHLETALRACKQLGIGIVIVEHNVPFVMRTAEYITVLQNGRVLAEGSPDEVAANRRVAEVFLGRAAMV